MRYFTTRDLNHLHEQFSEGIVFVSDIVTQDKQKRTFLHLGYFAQRDAQVRVPVMQYPEKKLLKQFFHLSLGSSPKRFPISSSLETYVIFLSPSDMKKQFSEAISSLI